MKIELQIDNMLFDLIINLVAYVLDIVLSIISVIFSIPSLFDDAVMFEVAQYIGYVFGNIALFNSFLPVTETFVLASIALTFKAAIVGFQVFMFLTNFALTIRRTYVSIRL